MILKAPQPIEGSSGKELRKLHDMVQQHLRALKAMDCKASGPFVTSDLEFKLDPNVMFEWQKHSHESATVPHYNELLEFINLRAQASKSLAVTRMGSAPSKSSQSHKSITSFMANASDSPSNCVVCTTEKNYFMPVGSSSSCHMTRRLTH